MRLKRERLTCPKCRVRLWFKQICGIRVKTIENIFQGIGNEI